MRKRLIVIICLLLALLSLSFLFVRKVLPLAGKFLIMETEVSHSDAVVVLNGGVDYYPRLIEAASIYNNGLADQVVVNGNRKTDVLRSLEAKGFKPACHWCENRLRLLSLFHVPRDKTICISAEDVYDTVSEAKYLGEILIRKGYTRVIITTSKFHTKRACFIWKQLFGKRLSISAVSAKEDPFDPDRWWKSGRQVRWVLAEYGAWIYYFWKNITDTQD